MSAVAQRRPGPGADQPARHLAPVPDQLDDRERLYAALGGIALDDEAEWVIRRLDRDGHAGVVAGWLEQLRPKPRVTSSPNTARVVEPCKTGALKVAPGLGAGKRIVVFIPEGPEWSRWLNTCTRAAQRLKGTIVAVAPTWPGAEQMLGSGEADAAMVARAEHLPRGRVLVGSEIPEQSDDPTPRQRRPTIIQRDGLPR